MRRLLATAALFAALHAGCSPGENVAGGAGAGNPGTPTALTCKAASDLHPDECVMTDTAGTRFTIGDASLHFAYMSFDYPEDAPVPADEFAFTSPLTYSDSLIVLDTPVRYDLETGAANPDPGTLLLPAGTYDRIKVKIADSDDSTAALRIRATFAYDGRTDRELTIELTFNNTAVFFCENGILLDDDDATPVMEIRLNTDLWLESLDIAALLDDGTLELDADGDLRIDQSNEHRYPQLETLIRTNIVQSGKLTQN